MSVVSISFEKGGCMMRHSTAGVALLAIFVSLHLAAQQAVAESPAPPKSESQATIKRLGFGISEITLLPEAASRIDIHTSEIAEDPSGRKFTSYSSIMYDLDGDVWVYKLTAPLSFVREQVVVESITRDYVYLKEGPPAGTQVVTVGVPELYGTEVGVNGE
jgi:hypothetical protein